MPNETNQTETELRAQIARMEAVIKDADNMPRAILELLNLIVERRHVAVPLAIAPDGRPYLLTPNDTQALAGTLYQALVQELGMTAKLLDLDRENAHLRESNIYMRQLLALIIEQAGGTARINERTIATMQGAPEIVTWVEGQTTVIQTRRA